MLALWGPAGEGERPLKAGCEAGEVMLQGGRGEGGGSGTWASPPASSGVETAPDSQRRPCYAGAGAVVALLVALLKLCGPLRLRA
jgi:hypothetical protein